MQTRLDLTRPHQLHPELISLPVAHAIVTGLAVLTAVLALVELAAH